MAEFFFEYGLFLAKSFTVLVVIFLVVAGVAAIAARGRMYPQREGEIELTCLNEQFDEMKETVEAAVLDKDEFKEQLKAHKKEEKQAEKARKKARKQGDTGQQTESRRVYVLDFDGDIKASEVTPLREEISAILTYATPQDEVVLRLESAGGLVHTYGLAASQLERIKAREIPLTVCVDQVAASGGYMMACLADKLLAAPFAILGSIGVVAQVPNFHRVLKKHDVDYELFTAGEYKRTVTLFGENTEKGKQKFKEELEDTHALFKEFVTQYRPQLEIAKVATGEVWFGKRALAEQLIDGLSTSDDYLMQACKEAKVYRVRYEAKKTLQERIGDIAVHTSDSLFTRLWTRLEKSRFLSR